MRQSWWRADSLGIAGVSAAAAVVFAAALAVMATFAGWSDVARRFEHAQPVWLAFVVAAQAIAFAGYVFAYRGVAAVDGGRSLGLRRSTQLVAVGFGAFLARGGEALDTPALRPRGVSSGAGRVRVLALDALEHAPLVPAAFVAAIALLAGGRRRPGLDFTIPWSVLPPIGTVAAILLVRRRSRFVGADGWRGSLGSALEGIALLFRLVLDPRRWWPALAGSTVYWAADVGSLWAAARIFYVRPSVPGVVIAHAVGYVLTRRTLPLAGAGAVEVLMPLTLAAAGVPFPAAIAGVFVYRLVNLWLPLAPALVALPSVRRLLEEREAPAPAS